MAEAQREADDRTFSEWLTDRRIRTLAPETAAFLIGLAESVVEAALKLPVGDPIRPRAKAYAKALLRVGQDMGQQQGVVLARLGALVDAGAATRAEGGGMSELGQVDWAERCRNCARCCIPIAFAVEEWERWKHLAQRPYRLIEADGEILPEGYVHPLTADNACVFVMPGKRCAIYAERPDICREYGTEPQGACPYWGGPEPRLDEGAPAP